MHIFLLKMHMVAYKDGIIALITIISCVRPDGDLEPFYMIIGMIALTIVTILDFADYAVSIRQSNDEVQETQVENNYKLHDKSKWMHKTSILNEMRSITWFIIRYNMVYQYFSHLAIRWVQSESTLEMISDEIANNRYISKLKTGFKDTITITNFLILSAIIMQNDKTIMRRAIRFGICMHCLFVVYIMMYHMMVGFKVVLSYRPRLSQTKVYELPPCPPPCPIYIQEQENSSVTVLVGDKTQYAESNRIQMKKEDQCFISMPDNYSQHFSCMPYSKVSVTTNYNITDCSTITDGRQYTYEMKFKPHGIGIIINNEEFKIPSLKSRLGANIDSGNLWNLFNYLGFDIQRHDNKTHIEMRHILNEVAAMDHDKYNCLMVAILTHGDYGDVLYGTTGGGIMIQEVIETFSGTRCPSLIGKPKIFIIQACRGRRHNRAIQLSDEWCDMTDSSVNPTVHPNISDYLVAYSTIPGHASFRNNNSGSIYISTLVKTFIKYAAYEDVVTMLERVTDEVIKYEPRGHGDSRQSPEIRSTLRGKVYFTIANENFMWEMI